MTALENDLNQNEGVLSYLNDQERLKAYNDIVAGCQHLWSKNEPQWDAIELALRNFALLADQDPFFLAHLTSFAVKELDHRDLQVLSTFASSLSDADGTPFSLGSAYRKPNLRIISQAALVRLNPNQVLRVLTLAETKMVFGNKPKAVHYSKHLRTAVRKYLKYRESNPKALEGIFKSGQRQIMKRLYYKAKIGPSLEAAQALRWPQYSKITEKWGQQVEVAKSVLDFSGLSDLDIAKKVVEDRIYPTAVLGALDRKISPVIAAAVLQNATPDQTVVLTGLFQEQGLLADQEVKEVYTAKISQAKTALDRVERINTITDEETKKIMKKAKSEKRKSDMGDFSSDKVYMMIDISSSMGSAIEIAKESGSIFAEAVPNPEENFFWGTFNDVGRELPKPKTFEKDAFHHALYNVRAGGATNTMALYERALRRGATVLVYVTDQGHYVWDRNQTISNYIDQARARGLPDPRLVVIVNTPRACVRLRDAYKQKGIPVVELNPNQLKESALVSQAIKTAIDGPVATINKIMDTPLLKLPRWWTSI